MKRQVLNSDAFTPLENETIHGGVKNQFFLMGFTFLEVLFTVVIIAVGLLAIMNWVPAAIKTKIELERKTIAIFLAQEKMDEIKKDALSSFSDDFNQSVPWTFSAPFDTFIWTASDDRGDPLRAISVSTWHIEDPEKKVIFHTEIARR